jgi:serine protease Do
MMRRFRSRRWRLAAGAVLCGAGTLCAQAAEQTLPNLFETLQKQVQQEMEKCREAIVRIEAIDEHGQLAGTGFFVDPNGLLYTSYTVAGASHDIIVRRGDLKYPARRLVADPRCGIAILKVELETAFLPIGRSTDLTCGSPVMTFGYPMDLPLTPSFGLLSGFDRKYLGRYFATTHLRANVSVQRGEGGAPLLNMKGEAVGILISSLDQGSASFILPVEAAEKVRRDYVRFGSLRPAWLGLQMENAPEATLGSTAVVGDLFQDSPAQKAGVIQGDVILELGGRKVTSPEDMIDASFFLSADDPAAVRLARSGAEMTLQVTPADPPRPKSSLPVLGSTAEPGAGQALQLGAEK